MSDVAASAINIVAKGATRCADAARVAFDRA
jgi:hypothetical protein